MSVVEWYLVLMVLLSSRSLNDLHPVLKNPNASGPSPVYQVFTNLNIDGWINKTVIASGNYDNEFPKTFGHYHSSPGPETYSVISGQGILLLQKKHFEKNIWNPEKVDEVLLIRANVSDKIIIPPNYGHSWSNTGNGPLVLLDDWHTPHSPLDYADIKRLHGLAYYLTKENDQIKPIPNPNYQDLPKPIWLTAKEFTSRHS